jgi:hypothetical protein
MHTLTRERGCILHQHPRYQARGQEMQALVANAALHTHRKKLRSLSYSPQHYTHACTPPTPFCTRPRTFPRPHVRGARRTHATARTYACTAVAWSEHFIPHDSCRQTTRSDQCLRITLCFTTRLHSCAESRRQQCRDTEVKTGPQMARQARHRATPETPASKKQLLQHTRPIGTPAGQLLLPAAASAALSRV